MLPFYVTCLYCTEMYTLTRCVYVSTVSSYWLIHNFLIFLIGLPADIVCVSVTLSLSKQRYLTDRDTVMLVSAKEDFAD